MHRGVSASYNPNERDSLSLGSGGQPQGSIGAEKHGELREGNDYSGATPLPVHYSESALPTRGTGRAMTQGGREGNDGRRGMTNQYDDVCGAKRELVDFLKPGQWESLLKAKVGHQVSSFIKNPSFLEYLKSPSSDFTSVTSMMCLLNNVLFCEIEPLQNRVQKEVVPKLLEYCGFLQAVMNHVCSLPSKANDHERENAVSFLGTICKLFQLILSTGNVLATRVLPVDALCGTTRQLTAQEMRFQPLHNKAKEILKCRDKLRQTLYDSSEIKALENDEIVLPTQKELEQKTLPIGLLSNIISGPYPNALQYLDIQYRLLREDFIHPLRCAFHEIERDEEESHRTKVYNDVMIKSEAYSSFDGSTFEVSFTVQGHHQIRWERSKRFMYGDLVCLMNDDHSTILFATVAERNTKDLRKGIVTVDFRTKVDIMGLPPTNYQMIESPGFYAAYSPILKHLHALQKNPESLPFSRYIVELKTDVQHPLYITDENEYVLDLHTVICNTQHDGDQSPCKSLNVLDDDVWRDIPTPTLDDSQKGALRSALTKELSIIQGPPGTGKTYIGLKIVETLLQNRASWDKHAIARASTSSIVVVCYTNHALDQFLEGIIKQKGITIDKNTQVRRIGGRSKSLLVEEYNINTFVRNHLRARGIFGYWRKKNSKVVQKIDALNDLIKCKFDPAKVKIYASFIGIEIRELILESFDFPFLAITSTNKVASWLGLKATAISKAKKAKFNSCHDAAEADRKIAGEDDDEEDGIMQEFGRKQLCEFFETFATVEPLTERRANEVVQLQVEDIEPYVRLQLFKYGLQSVKGELEDKLEHGKEREELYEQQRRIAMVHCLQEADIIGLTTTGAAKHNSLLSKIDTKIVIIEEAAEVLEAHVVSSLNHNTQHLVLIGDHKQLRPKTNDHILARDHHLDVSLFERLVSNGFPCVTLQVQHRMRPEIASLVSSHIYDNALIDAPSTENYPAVLGMKHNVFFVDHLQQESVDHDLKSPCNDFEACFLARLCKYLLQQHTYTEEHITVITPYTGQMYNLREKFESLEMTKVRITPIDSYQGEENDIILLSLVRSERPGFVKDKNRICVAMSRAKHGLYVIGNFSGLLMYWSKLWRSLAKDMKAREKFGTCIPLVCQGHKTLTEVCKPEDFDSVPHGGCSLQCNARLPCRHMCPKKCHPDPDMKLHSEIQCEEPCSKSCAQGHRCKKMCDECRGDCGPCETLVDQKIPKCGHQQQVPCHCDPKRFVCQEPCPEILQCGHKCKNTCGEPHTSECQELIAKLCPCKHEGKAECYMTEEQYSRKCKADCGKILMCGHRCKGKCGECSQGRLHKPCREKCNRTLTCGHHCSSPCAKSCPPCKKQCPMTCPHGPCGHTCHKVCSPCAHKCKRRCEHQECTRNCGDVCDCKPCDKPCQKQLPCKHDCMGLCGEECPDVCRVCDKDAFNDKVPIIFGTEDLEDNPELRIIMLDCGHMFDVESLDKWVQSEDEGKIQWKCCLVCKQPIFKTNRYTDIVKGIVTDLNKVKKKEVVMSREERRQYKTKLEVIIRNSHLTKNREKVIACLDEISDKQLQAEYIIFNAEHSVTRATDDTRGEMDTDSPRPIVLYTYSMHEVGKELHSAMKTLKSQKERFLSKLGIYRNQTSISMQVLHDVQAEQRRIQLLSVVLKVQSQIKAKSIHINPTDQEKLDEFLSTYETRHGPVCSLDKAAYESSMAYIQSLLQRHPDITGISQEEKQMIIQAMYAKPGSWYKCPQGHVYNIGECGGAMEESRCPECNSTIGGRSHRLHTSNVHAGDFDGSQHAAWSTGANIRNFDLHDLQ